jgi:hypothetical protein
LGLSAIAVVESGAQILGARMVQVIEDLQGVPPGSTRVVEVADGLVIIAQVSQILGPCRRPVRGSDAEGLLAVVNGGPEIAAKLMRELEGVPRDGLLEAAGLAGQVQRLLAGVESQVEIAQDGMVETDVVKDVCLVASAP